MELQSLIDKFLEDVCGGKTNQTEAAYRAKLRRLTAFFGPEMDAGQITVNDLDRFKLDLQTRKKKLHGTEEVDGKLSPFTIRTCLVTTRFFFKWAASKRYIPMNPMEGVRIQDAPKPKPKAVMSETVTKLLEAASTHGPNWERARNIALIYVLRDTGGRAGGLAGARLGDLDLKRGWLMVTEKGETQRPLFLIASTVQALRTWLQWRPEVHPVDDRLFSGCEGSGLSYGGIYSALRTLATAAGIEGELWNPHSFRHAFARDSLLNGAELSQVSAMMGHTDTRVTSMYYARWENGELKKTHSQYSPVLNMPDIQPVFEGEPL